MYLTRFTPPVTVTKQEKEANRRAAAFLQKEYTQTRRHLIDSCILLIDEYKQRNSSLFIHGETYHAMDEYEALLLEELQKRNPYAKSISRDEFLHSTTIRDMAITGDPETDITKIDYDPTHRSQPTPGFFEAISIITGATTKYEQKLAIDMASLIDEDSPTKQAARERLHKQTNIRELHVHRAILQQKTVKEKRHRCAALCETGITYHHFAYHPMNNTFRHSSETISEWNQQLVYEVNRLVQVTRLESHLDELGRSLVERSTVLLELIQEPDGTFPSAYQMSEIRDGSTEEALEQYGKSADIWKTRVFSLKNRFPITNVSVALQIEVLTAQYQTTMELQYLRGNITDAKKRHEWRGYYDTIDSVRQTIPSFMPITSLYTITLGVILLVCLCLFLFSRKR